MSNLKTLYQLPKKVFFCKKCVFSNQVPRSVPEFLHVRNRKGAKYLNIDKNGVCDPCKVHENKKTINWEERENELLKILKKHRSNSNQYDCLVPGSGGKDSAMQAHLLKYKYGMNPLCITWPPILYTDYGRKNLENFINIGGFDNLTFQPNGRVMKILTKLSIENLLHPFQTFILGQKNLAPKIASKFGIKLVFYGENDAEHNESVAESKKSLTRKFMYQNKNLKNLYLSGVKVKDLINKYKLTYKDLSTFLPSSPKDLLNDLEIRYLGYYLKWIPQEAYYYAAENTGFKARPFRTQGTYSKYNSIDDKIDDLHYYTTYIKFGVGRATYDASQEVRNFHITRKEAQALVKKFDGEFPDNYFKDIMDFLEIKQQDFMSLCDKFRSPHLWVNIKGKWKLRHDVNKKGYND